MTDPRERTIFLAAVELDGAARASYLDEACRSDAALRTRVERLLALDRPEADHATTPHPPGPSTTPIQPGEASDVDSGRRSRTIGLRIGDSIDGFKILEAIGEGGQGHVYLAEQLKPVKRRVALKVIKVPPGKDSEAVLARFEAERQALALMDHPGIARVLQAGTTDDGLPYFAMEYVKGVPITDAADRNQLDTTERLELMRKVCDAVQHAHMNGIIHRDLKPANILVTTDANDELVAKVIDFGVAKATTYQLTDLAVHTQVGHFIGTPAYMSPEQADLTVADIDTRTDVYSLGVILYELLTGQLPFDPRELREAGLEEMRRRIREDDPPKPSTRLTSLDEQTATRISKARRIRLDQLQKNLASELDWIPLKAIRKLRSERYATPTDLARDLQRYLDGEPLEAGPESTGYRLRKFVKRRRVPIAVGGAFAAILVAATVVSGWLAEQNRRLAVDQSRLYESERNAKDEMEEAKEATEQALAEAKDALLRMARSEATIRTEVAVGHLDGGDRAAAEKVHASVDPGHRAWDWWVVESYLDRTRPQSSDYRSGRPPLLEDHALMHGFRRYASCHGVSHAVFLAPAGDEADAASRLRLVEFGPEGDVSGEWWLDSVDEPVLANPDAVVISSNGRWMAVAGGGRIQIWDLVEHRFLRRLPVVRSGVNDMRFLGDGTRLATTADDIDDVWIHELTEGRRWQVVPSSLGGPMVAASDQLNCLVMEGPDGRGIRRVAADARGIQTDEIEIVGLAKIGQAIVSPDGNRLAVVGIDGFGTTRLWDVELFEPFRVCSHETLATDQGVHFSWRPDGAAFAVVEGGLRMRLFELDQYCAREVKQGQFMDDQGLGDVHVEWVGTTPVFIRDVGGAMEREWSSWELPMSLSWGSPVSPAGEYRLQDQRRDLPGTRSGIESRDAAVGFEGNLDSIEAELGSPFDSTRLRSPRGISPDGRFLAVADRLAVYIVELGSRLVTLRLPVAEFRLVNRLAFTSDGTALMVEYDDATTQIIDAVPSVVRDLARRCETFAEAEQVVASWIEENLDVLADRAGER